MSYRSFSENRNSKTSVCCEDNINFVRKKFAAFWTAVRRRGMLCGFFGLPSQSIRYGFVATKMYLFRIIVARFSGRRWQFSNVTVRFGVGNAKKCEKNDIINSLKRQMRIFFSRARTGRGGRHRSTKGQRSSGRKGWPRRALFGRPYTRNRSVRRVSHNRVRVRAQRGVRVNTARTLKLLSNG